ncbi:transglutaminase-like domain-containing protein [Hamadaea tsunoensis]|uniref:transglutaminase-like domain-containing protein n=1 Tax=Hamadaea tsunoensis TaxID=53368 RepID=UPI00040AA7A6|nr:transglutaminase-like domain-containing protein [Hamadaea tsunoensis]
MPENYAGHSRFSDPGPYAGLLAAAPADLAGASAVARNILLHYVGSQVALSPERLAEIDNRWVSRILATDQARHAYALDVPRPLADRVAGCCRDFTLLTVAILRAHGVPARSRIGFADYFEAGFHHDHVIAEVWDGDRWVRADPQLDPAGDWDFDPQDMPPFGTRFATAAQVWQGYRSGALDPARYGVSPTLPHLCGVWLIGMYVYLEAAHVMRDETLLWDGWGAMPSPEDGPGDVDGELLDRLADLLVAEKYDELGEWYRADERLRVPATVECHSPATGPRIDTLTPLS